MNNSHARKLNRCRVRNCPVTAALMEGDLCIKHWYKSIGKECPTFETGMRASQAAAENGWTAHEMELVDKAIRNLAMRLFQFTADDVWRELGDGFPVTKGMASRLSVAQRRGYILNTGTTTIARRGGAHDHAQRLTVWQSQLVLAG